MRALPQRLLRLDRTRRAGVREDRERLQKARHRFHANDCIAPYIEPDELALLQDEVEEKLLGVLQSLVIDVESDHNTRETARRVAKMYLMEVFRGRYTAMPQSRSFRTSST